jgi:hypothetical protein
MRCRAELKSLSMQGNTVIKVILLTLLLQSGPQCIPKIIERKRSFRMRCRAELKSLSIE